MRFKEWRMPRGKHLGEWQNKTTKVTEPEIAQKITYMLKGVVEKGTGKNARVDGVEVAGKTGSTQLPFENEAGTKDHWFVGYTPELVGAVWLGYDQTDQDHYLPSSSSATAPVIFKEILSKSASEISNKSFNLAPIEKKYKQEVQKREEEEDKIRKEQMKENEKIRKEQINNNEKMRKSEEKAWKKAEKEEQKERKKEEKEKKKNEKD